MSIQNERILTWCLGMQSSKPLVRPEQQGLFARFVWRTSRIASGEGPPMTYVPDGTRTIPCGSSHQPLGVRSVNNRKRIAKTVETTGRLEVGNACILAKSLKYSVTKISLVRVTTLAGAVLFISIQKVRLWNGGRFDWTGLGVWLNFCMSRFHVLIIIP